MSKQKTNAYLEAEIKKLQNELQYRDEKIGDLQSDLSASRTFRQEAINEIACALDNMALLPLPDLPLPDYSSNPLRYKSRKPSLPEVLFKIGQLIVYTQEYFELKDRMLPLQKSEVLKSQINENRN